MADEDLRDFVIEQLAELDVTSRPRFGAQHMYLGATFFGLIADGEVYFRTDEESRPAYLDRGMKAFQPSERPRGPRTVDRHFEVPADVLEDRELLCEWAERASRA